MYTHLPVQWGPMMVKGENPQVSLGVTELVVLQDSVEEAGWRGKGRWLRGPAHIWEEGQVSRGGYEHLVSEMGSWAGEELRSVPSCLQT